MTGVRNALYALQNDRQEKAFAAARLAANEAMRIADNEIVAAMNKA